MAGYSITKERDVIQGTYDEATDVGASIVKSGLRKRQVVFPDQVDDLYKAKQQIIALARPILKNISDIDYEKVATVPLFPEIMPTHYELEQSRALGKSKNKGFRYSTEVIEAYKKLVMKWVPKNRAIKLGSEAKLTIAKRKNTGWPDNISGTDSDFNSMSQYISAIIARYLEAKGNSLENYVDRLAKAVGYKPFFAYGERFQSTGKKMPYYFRDKYMYDVAGVFDRARRVNMEPKLYVFAQRKNLKVAQEIVFALPMHDPTPGHQSGKIKKWMKDDGYAVFPFDFKNYEYFSAGREKLKQIREIIAWMISYGGGDGKRWLENNQVEQDTRFLMPYKDMIIETDEYESLPSGEGTTTVHNMVANDLAMLHFTEQLRDKGLIPKSSKLEDSFGDGKFVDDVSHGDDTILAVKNSVLADTPENRDLIIRMFQKQDYEIGFEDNLKFLGQNYDIYEGPSAWRLFEKMISPERVKHPDLFNLGFALRLELVPPFYRNEFMKELLPTAIKILKEGLKPRFKYNKSFRLTKGELVPDYKEHVYDAEMYLDPKTRLAIIKKGIDTANKIAEGTLFLDNLVYSLTHQGEAIPYVSPEVDAMFGFLDKKEGVTFEEFEAEIKDQRVDIRNNMLARVAKQRYGRDSGMQFVRHATLLFEERISDDAKFSIATRALVSLAHWCNATKITKANFNMFQ